MKTIIKHKCSFHAKLTGTELGTNHDSIRLVFESLYIVHLSSILLIALAHFFYFFWLYFFGGIYFCFQGNFFLF